MSVISSHVSALFFLGRIRGGHRKVLDRVVAQSASERCDVVRRPRAPPPWCGLIMRKRLIEESRSSAWPPA
jgi:hypothetical protein